MALEFSRDTQSYLAKIKKNKNIYTRTDIEQVRNENKAKTTYTLHLMHLDIIKCEQEKKKIEKEKEDLKETLTKYENETEELKKELAARDEKKKDLLNEKEYKEKYNKEKEKLKEKLKQREALLKVSKEKLEELEKEIEKLKKLIKREKQEKKIFENSDKSKNLRIEALSNNVIDLQKKNDELMFKLMKKNKFEVEDGNKKSNIITYILQTIYKNYKSKNLPIVNENIRYIRDMFANSKNERNKTRQQDVVEFLRYILMNQNMTKYFQFVLNQAVTCGVSNINRPKAYKGDYETIHMLPNLENTFEGIEDVYLDRCQTIQHKGKANNAIKYYYIEPGQNQKYLIVQLKIFNNKLQKINKNIIYEQSMKYKNKNFELVGIIEHRGNTIQRGHYVSYIKTGNTWTLADDTAVTKNVQSLTKQPYVLFYKINGKANKHNVYPLTNQGENICYANALFQILVSLDIIDDI